MHYRYNTLHNNEATEKAPPSDNINNRIFSALGFIHVKGKATPKKKENEKWKIILKKMFYSLVSLSSSSDAAQKNKREFSLGKRKERRKFV